MFAPTPMKKWREAAFANWDRMVVDLSLSERTEIWKGVSLFKAGAATVLSARA